MAVTLALPTTALYVALMVAVPTLTAVTVPRLTLATPLAVELQVALAVKSRDVPSEKIPMAVNFWLKPNVKLALGGVTEMLLKVALVTVTTVDDDLPDRVAVMVAEPAATAVTTPLLLTVATAGVEVVHAAWVVST